MKTIITERIDGLWLIEKLYGVAYKRGITARELEAVMQERFGTSNALRINSIQFSEVMEYVARLPKIPIEQRPNKNLCRFNKAAAIAAKGERS